MQDFDGFCATYMQQWEKRCTVRNGTRTRFSVLAPDDDIFPLSHQLAASHEAVTALGPDAIREILIRTAFGMQSGIASVEVDVVADLCGRLAHGRDGLALPRAARQVALAVGVDEFYHALVAREFVEDLSRATGVQPGPEVQPELQSGIEVALDYMRAEAPAELLPLAEIVTLCFAEHFVTESMFQISKDGQRDTAFVTATREHLIDEGRHQRFFEMLLRHVWAGLDEDRRIALGQVLPGFFDRFLGGFPSIREQYIAILGAVGFAPARAAEILDETFAMGTDKGPPLQKYEMPFARHCLSLLQTADLVAHEPTRTGLVEAGWLAPPGERERPVA